MPRPAAIMRDDAQELPNVTYIALHGVTGGLFAVVKRSLACQRFRAQICQSKR